MTAPEVTPPELPKKSTPEKNVPPADYYRQLYVLSRFVLNRMFDITIEGKENILNEPAEYAANHVNFFDSLIMSMIHTEHTGKPMRFVIKQEYMEGKGIDNKGKFGRSLKWFMKHTWQIPVDREAKDNGASAMNMVRKAKEAKGRGESTGIHPGGTRIDDESDGLPRFNDGVGLIAMTAGLPVVPTSLNYGKKPEGHFRKFKKRSVLVKYGEPVFTEQFATLPDPDAEQSLPTEISEPERLTSKERIRRITTTTEVRVARLLNVGRTGVKATLKKYRDQQAERHHQHDQE